MSTQNDKDKIEQTKPREPGIYADNDGLPLATPERLRQYEAEMRDQLGEPGGSKGIMIPDFDAVNNHKPSED